MAAERVAIEPEPGARRTRRAPPEAQQLFAVIAIMRDGNRQRKAADLVQIQRDDAGDAAATVHQRPAAEPGIHGTRVDGALERVFPIRVERVERGDAAGARAPTGVADARHDEDLVADRGHRRVDHRQRIEVVPGDLHERDPRREILRDDLAGKLASVEQRHAHVAAAEHDVVHGEDQAMAVDEHAAARTIGAEHRGRGMRLGHRHLQMHRRGKRLLEQMHRRVHRGSARPTAATLRSREAVFMTRAPMHARELTLDLDPWSLFRALASKERPFFIDAGQPWGEEWVSSMGFRPRMQFRVTAGDPADAPLACLDARLAAIAPPRSARSRPHPVPFAGGVVAAIAYETQHAVEQLPIAPGEARDAPRLAGAVYDFAVSYDHVQRRYRLASWHLDAAALAAVAEEIHEAVADAARTVALPVQAAPITTPVDATTHAARVARIHDYIAAGDVYQVNLTQRFDTRLPVPALDVYERLRTVQRVPFGRYLDLGPERVLSGSPELFLRRRGDRVTTCPIKGTRPRGTTPAADAALAAELERDPKERAEHVMIVDLERNDLGRLCRTGSVAVAHLAACVSFDTVHHLVSTVTGTLRPNLGMGELLRATFPSGSITGAPKIRAMEIVAELEQAPRGFYTGAVGWIDASGDCDLNVAIRTAVASGDRLTYHAGGGIVADSDAARERDELYLKAAAFFRALGTGDPRVKSLGGSATAPEPRRSTR